MRKPSTRTKWRSSPSPRRRVLRRNLTTADIVRDAMLRPLPTTPRLSPTCPRIPLQLDNATTAEHNLSHVWGTLSFLRCPEPNFRTGFLLSNIRSRVREFPKEMPGMKLRFFCVVVGLLSLVQPLAAQTTDTRSTSSQVPPFIQFSSFATDVNGKPLTGMVGVTFYFYAEQQG